jgi:DnaJ family protein B protein 12
MPWLFFPCQHAQLALRLHPDKNKAWKADEAFKLLSKAFSTLSNPDKRAFYDR